MQKLFRDQRQYRLFIVLCLATLFNFSMIGVRIYHLNMSLPDVATTQDLSRLRGTTTFLFLVWNLFLAWIPYWVALAIGPMHESNKSKIFSTLLFFTWLFFFPNAPYILTDLLHLKSRSPIPHWYDLMLIASFAWTGLMLGLLSLYEIHLFLRKKMGNFRSWAVVILCIALCGYGVYLGRYLRWNTWDLIAQPLELSKDIIYTLRHPFMHMDTLGIAIIIAVFMLLAYLTIVAMKGFENNTR